MIDPVSETKLNTPLMLSLLSQTGIYVSAAPVMLVKLMCVHSTYISGLCPES